MTIDFSSAISENDLCLLFDLGGRIRLTHYTQMKAKNTLQIFYKDALPQARGKNDFQNQKYPKILNSIQIFQDGRKIQNGLLMKENRCFLLDNQNL